MLKCDYCGKFTTFEDSVVYQPETPPFRYEPDDPQTVCLKCAEKIGIGHT